MIPADWTEQSTIEGIITLHLPPQWTPEDEEDDGTTAFADESDDFGGVLRVTPLVMERDSDLTDRDLPRILAKRGPRPEKVTEDRYLLKRIEEDEEEGEPLVQVTWELGHRVSPREVALVVASYTLGVRETLDTAASFLSSLDASIRACQIETEFDLEADEDEEEELEG